MHDSTQIIMISMRVRRGMPTPCTLLHEATALYLQHRRWGNIRSAGLCKCILFLRYPLKMNPNQEKQNWDIKQKSYGFWDTNWSKKVWHTGWHNYFSLYDTIVKSCCHVSVYKVKDLFTSSTIFHARVLDYQHKLTNAGILTVLAKPEKNNNNVIINITICNAQSLCCEWTYIIASSEMTESLWFGWL